MVGVVVHGAYLSYECWLCSVYSLIMEVSCIYAVVVTLAFPLEHFVSFHIQPKSVGTTLLNVQRCVPWMLPVVILGPLAGISLSPSLSNLSVCRLPAGLFLYSSSFSLPSALLVWSSSSAAERRNVAVVRWRTVTPLMIHHRPLCSRKTVTPPVKATEIQGQVVLNQ